MAIARGAGTEIIRTAMFEDINNSGQNLIIGEQHHIYTVLSIICRNNAQNASEKGSLRIVGWDAFAASSASPTNDSFHFAVFQCALNETYVWNDKFSFNGYEPDASAMTDALSTAAEQNAIADQGGSQAQFLNFYTDGANTKYDVIVTYIDQNNS